MKSLNAIFAIVAATSNHQNAEDSLGTDNPVSSDHIDLSIHSQSQKDSIPLPESTKAQARATEDDQTLARPWFYLSENKVKIENGKVDLSSLCRENPSIETLEIVGNEEKIDVFVDSGNENNTIKQLKIRNCKLNVGSLEKILGIKGIQSLDLSGIDLSRLDFNISLKNMKSALRSLDLSYCNLNKDFIRKLTKFTNLEELILRGNDLSSLKNFSFNSLMKTLRILNLENTKVKYKLIKKLVSFQRLEELYLGRNDLSFLKKGFNFLKGNKFSPLMKRFGFNSGKLRTTLKKLDLNGCNLTDVVVQSLQIFKNLEELILRDNTLFNSDINFGKLRSTLKKLDLFGCKMTSATIKNLEIFEKLEELNLSKNPTFVYSHDSFTFGNLMNTLRTLELSSNQLYSGVIFTKLSKFKKLEKLNLSFNYELSLADLCNDFDFGDLKDTLKELNFCGCNLKGDDVKRLTVFTCLENLNLSGSNLSSLDAEFDFGNLKKTLENLVLNSNASKTNPPANSLAIFKQITEFAKLRFLSLSGHDMSGLDTSFSFGNLVNTLEKLYILGCNFKKELIQNLRESSSIEIYGFESSNETHQ